MNLGEVIAHDELVAVDGFLARHHDPYAPAAPRADFFHQCLQTQHKAHIVTDELPHLVDHEQEAELPTHLGRTMGCVVVHHMNETVHRDHVVFGPVEPVARGGFAHAERALESIDHIVFEIGVCLAGLNPRFTVYPLERAAEFVGLAFRVDEHLELRELQVLPAKAQMLEEHALERTQKRRFRGVAFLPLAALRIDVEKDSLGWNTSAATHLGVDHLVFELAVEIIDSRLAIDHLVRQQIRQHFQEVRLARSEEARNPNADFVSGNIEGGFIVFEEVRKVALKLARHHVLGKLLLDGLLVALRYFDDAVNGTIDIFAEKVPNYHDLPLYKIEGPIVIPIR